MGGKRVEIAHFWQDHCLAILVVTTPRVPSEPTWLDAGPTRVRLRPVDAVSIVPAARGFLGWGPFAFLLGSFFLAILLQQPMREDDLLEIVAGFGDPGFVPEAPSLRLRPLLRTPMYLASDINEVFSGCALRTAPSPPGEVFKIANGTGHRLTVRCSDVTVNLGDEHVTLIAAPDTNR